MASSRVWVCLLLLCAAALAQADECAPLEQQMRIRLPGKTSPAGMEEGCDSSRVAPPPLLQDSPLQEVPDRWRIVDSLPGYSHSLLNPYQRNILKGDKPLSNGWFINLSAISDTVIEARDIPTPVAPQVSKQAGDIDVFGSGKQTTYSQNFIFEAAYLKGDTIFRPPDYEFRFVPVVNVNRTEVEEIRALHIDPRDGDTRDDSHLGIQGAFFDMHLRNVSERYDFDSLRIGIQPFNADFRGFLFQDNQFGVRLFGTRDNNIFQYNLAWFRRLEKDTNSGLNDIGEGLRKDDVLVANLYWQDLLAHGFTTQATFLYNRNREDDVFYDDNGFIARPASLGFERPRHYDVFYSGLNGDGHFGRLNLTFSGYLAMGDGDPGPFTTDKTRIQAGFLAAEAGFDMDWIRWRFSGVYASGDKDPYDDVENGFDAVFENPIIAGADTSFWIRQGIPLIGGGGVTLSTRNGILPNLRSSKEHGQSNFTNPGLQMLGVGSDLDLTPSTRLSFNANYLRFDNTAVLQALRQQANIDNDIGWDVSAAVIWRPLEIQNVVFRLSAARLFPGKGFDQLYADDNRYSVLANLILTY